ncbi:MAG: methyltransferase domain-containing protein [Pseudomonadota bacterium]
MAVTQAARLSPEDWSKYWRQPAITTFSQQFPGNYDGEIAAFWSQQFADLADGSTVIDLATGNGAVALLAVREAAKLGRAWTVRGVDYADIRPTTDLSDLPDVQRDLGVIEFIGKTNIEATGLTDTNADLIVSQYGFEYSDVERAAHEAYRLLKPGGRIALIVHHAQSGVMLESAEGLSQMQFMMHKEQLDQRVEAVIRAADQASDAGDKRWVVARKKLNSTLRRLQARAAKAAEPRGFINSVAPSFVHAIEGLAAKNAQMRLQHVARMRDEVRAYQERMADLRSAALDQAGCDALCEALKQAGFEQLERGMLHYGAQQILMGWTVTAVRLRRHA